MLALPNLRAGEVYDHDQREGDCAATPREYGEPASHQTGTISFERAKENGLWEFSYLFEFDGVDLSKSELRYGMGCALTIIQSPAARSICSARQH